VTIVKEFFHYKNYFVDQGGVMRNLGIKVHQEVRIIIFPEELKNMI